MNVSKEQIYRIVREVIASVGAQNEATPATPATPAASSPAAKTVRAAVLVEPRKFEIKEFPIREIADDEILIKVEACGPIGLLMIAVLRAHGVNNIIALDGNPQRLSLPAAR